MPRELDFDRCLRDYHNLTPGERDAVVRQVIRDAKEARADAMKALFRTAGSQSRQVLARLFGMLRPVGGLLAAAWERYRLRLSLRATAVQLYAMDDRELKDIGLRRGDIAFVLSGIKDPTRRPRTARSLRETLRGIDYASPSLEPTQRVGGPLLRRKVCAG
jgi:uncharacterized protein YjiS (DUF1127 family)